MKNKKLKNINIINAEFKTKYNLDKLKFENRIDYTSKINFKYHIKKIRDMNLDKNIFNKKNTISYKYNKLFTKKKLSNNKWSKSIKLNITKYNLKIYKTLENIKNKYNPTLINNEKANKISIRLKILSNFKRISKENIIKNQNLQIVNRINNIKNLKKIN